MLRPWFFASRSCSEICRASAFNSVNHMVCEHAAFSEKLFCYVHVMLVWGSIKGLEQTRKETLHFDQNRNNIWSNSWQKCRHFFRPSPERHLSAHGLPQGAPKRPYSFLFVVYSDFGPGSGNRSGKSWLFHDFGGPFSAISSSIDFSSTFDEIGT